MSGNDELRRRRHGAARQQGDGAQRRAAAPSDTARAAGRVAVLDRPKRRASNVIDIGTRRPVDDRNVDELFFADPSFPPGERPQPQVRRGGSVAGRTSRSAPISPRRRPSSPPRRNGARIVEEQAPARSRRASAPSRDRAAPVGKAIRPASRPGPSRRALLRRIAGSIAGAVGGVGAFIGWFRRVDVAATRSVWKAGSPRRRLLTIFTVVVVVFAALAARIALLQTGQGASFSAFGAEQRTKDQTIAADRGVIFDRDGHELVITVPATTLWANPKLISEPARAARAIAGALRMTPKQQETLEGVLRKTDRNFVFVARALDDEQAKAVTALDIKGIGWYDEPTRMYPAGDVAKSLLGRADVDGKGIAGLEEQYDVLLKGTPGSVIREVDGEGRSIPTGNRSLINPIPGQDLVLTISRPLQYQAEQALIEKVASLEARAGIAIVMDTKTGEIYALANVKRDPTNGTVSVSSANLAAVEANEPGSVAKVITIAGALNDGTVRPDSYFQVPGYLDFDGGPSKGGIRLRDAHGHDTEDMSVDHILGVSSNIGTYKVMQTIGTKRHEEYMRLFGLGAPTAIGFPNEQKGIVHSSENYHGTEAVTVAWGQGVSSTSLQLAAAINVIANRGTYVAPKLVKSVIDSSGRMVDTPGSESHPVITPAAATDMTGMMQTVVCKGTGKDAQVPGYDVAGKTGTSFKAQPNGTYEVDGHKVYYASFVGFFPAENPQVTVLVSIDEPPYDGDRYGGKVAAPVFTEIAKAAINQLRIAPPVSGGCQD